MSSGLTDSEKNLLLFTQQNKVIQQYVYLLRHGPIATPPIYFVAFFFNFSDKCIVLYDNNNLSCLLSIEMSD